MDTENINSIPVDLHTCYYKWINDIAEIYNNCDIQINNKIAIIKYIDKIECENYKEFVQFVIGVMKKYYNNKLEIQAQKLENSTGGY